MPSAAIQGHLGSYHDQAAQGYFGDYAPLYLDSFAEVFDKVRTEEADFGVVAVENSVVGSITPVYDLLSAGHDLTITGEVFVRVSHSLLGLPGVSLEEIKSVYSHPVALDQCRQFLGHHLADARILPADDTAGSAEFIAKNGDPTAAAIADGAVSERLGLQILAEAIEDDEQNFTRFLILQRIGKASAAARLKANKTSLLLERLTDDSDDLTPGTLQRALGCFAATQIGITKIESRPVIGRPWHYKFYLDFDKGAEHPSMKKALEALEALGGEWHELGTYQKGVVIGTSS